MDVAVVTLIIPYTTSFTVGNAIAIAIGEAVAIVWLSCYAKLLSAEAGTEQQGPNLVWLMCICMVAMTVGFRLLDTYRRRFYPNSCLTATYSYGTIMMAVGFFGYMATLFVFTEWKGLQELGWFLVCLGYFVAFALATMMAYVSVNGESQHQQRVGLNSKMSHTRVAWGMTAVWGNMALHSI